MATLEGTDLEKLAELATFEYKDQAIWFLNAYWDRVENEAEKFWQYVQMISELDLAKKGEGNAVDEMQAHRFLEKFEMTQTVREMRDKLRKIGIDKVKLISLIHIIMFYYDVDFSEMVNASQGDTSAELEAAQAKLEEVKVALEAAQASAAAAKEAAEAAKEAEAAAKEAEEAAKEAEAAAKASEAKALEAEAEAKAAQAELEAALAELKAQEDAYNSKTEELKKKSEEGGIVSRNRAKNELAQHLGEDPLPLRRAKIGQEAAVRKAEKATAAAVAAREVAEADRKEAEENRAKAEQAAAEATAAREEAEATAAQAEKDVEALVEAVEECEAAIEEAAKTAGSGGQGTMWWMQRQLEEDKKYLPKSRGGTSR